MARFIKSLLLPAALVLVFSAEECESDLSLEVVEEITVLPGGEVQFAVEQRSDSIGWLLDWDPPPSLEMGWDSVHLGMSGKKDYALRAWNLFPVGADLPGSYAPLGDPLSDWYVQFPSDLTREERGDNVFFRFQRNYASLDWLPMDLFEELLEEGEDLQDLMDLADEELDSLARASGRKWEEVDLGAEPLTKEDSLLWGQLITELKDLVGTGDPPFIELYRQVSENSILVSYLSEVALLIPAALSLPDWAEPDCSATVRGLVLQPLPEIEITPEDAWSLLLEEWGVDAGMDDEELAFRKEVEIQRLRGLTLSRVREALLTECRRSQEDLIYLDQRLEWLTGRYRIVDGELRNQSFRIHLSMPGELLATTADTVIDGQARWKLDLRDLTEREFSLTATSRMIGGY